MNGLLRASLLFLTVAGLAGCASRHGDNSPIQRGFYGGVSGGMNGL